MPTGVYERTEEIKAKLRSYTWNKGLTKETDKRVVKNGQAISKAHTGVKLSKKHCEAMSGALTGRKLSESHCQNISKSQKKRFAKMTPKERKQFTSPAVKASRELWTKMTKKERKKYLEHWIKASQTLEARQKISKTIRAQWATKTKEERREYCKSWFTAAQEANPSSIEKAIWKELDKLSLSYETHVSFNHGKFIVDICIPSQKLIIECNGDYWHNLPERKKRDKALEKYLIKYGWKLSWLWEHDINKNPELALQNGFKEIKRGENYGDFTKKTTY